MSFEITTTLRTLLKSKNRIKVVQGATSSGKTFSIIPILIDRALATPHQRITVVAETMQGVREGAMAIFMDFMIKEGRFVQEQWNGTFLKYRFRNGSTIQFKSFDTEGKAKASGKHQILFLNEANHIEYEIADALIVRTTGEIWLDFNADSEFWAHTEFVGREDVDFMKFTYKENEAIPPAIKEDLMRREAKALDEDKRGQRGYWWNWWQVYGLGEIGQLLENVYPVWQQADEKPDRFKHFVYGLDFGFEHPTALVKVWYCEHDLFVEELIYKSNLTSGGLLAEMERLEIEKDVEIMCDYSRPEMIQDLINAGYYALKANKSVDDGLSFINECNVTVSASAINIIEENKKYKRKKINGVVTEGVVKMNDDAMDAIRYAGMEIKSLITGVENSIL